MTPLAVTLPTNKTPGWGYTNLARALGAFTGLVPALLPADLPPDAPALPADEAPTLTFLNGVLQTMPRLPHGITLTPLPLSHALTPLATFASTLTPAFRLEVAAGTQLATPLHIHHRQTACAQADATLPVAGGALHIQLGQGSQLVIIEHFSTENDQPIWLCPVLHIVLENAATLHHSVLQTLNRQSYFTHSHSGTLAESASYHRTLVQAGAALARTETALSLGAKTTSQLHTLHLTGAHQLHDTTATLHFTAPGSRANVRQRNVLNGTAQHGGHSVFQGTFKVAQAAQQTDAFMRSESLLLSPAARLDQKPELEIFADDVKCSHGASSGGLDENALFYLQARGLPATVAKALLVGGFARAALENASRDGALPAAGLAYLEAALATWLAGADA